MDFVDEDELKERQQKEALFDDKNIVAASDFASRLKRYLTTEHHFDLFCPSNIFENVFASTIDAPSTVNESSVNSKGEKVTSSRLIEGDGNITMDEWTVFLKVFGPVEKAYLRARAVCDPTTGTCASWYRKTFDRAKTEEYVKEDPGSFTALVRPGKNTSDHAFTVCTAQHVPIRMTDEGYNFQGKKEVYPTMLDLMIQLAKDHVREQKDGEKQKWVDFLQRLEGDHAAWVKLDKTNPEEEEKKKTAVLSKDVTDALLVVCKKVAEAHARLKASVDRVFVYRFNERVGIFWSKLEDRIARFFVGNPEPVEKLPLERCLEPEGLKTRLEEFAKDIQEAADKIGGDPEVFDMEVPSIDEMELQLYQKFNEVLFACGVKREGAVDVSLWRPSPSGRRNLDDLFWFRYFEMTDHKVVTRLFANALRIHVLHEHSQPLPDGVFQNIVQSTCDLTGESQGGDTTTGPDDIITFTEWIEFLNRFGPIEQCYKKTSSVCDSKGQPASWLKLSFDRNLANSYLSSQKGKFLVRGGRQPPSQALVVCLNPENHVLVRNTPQGFMMTGDNKFYATIRDILFKVAIDKGYQEELNTLNKSEDDWKKLDSMSATKEVYTSKQLMVMWEKHILEAQTIRVDKKTTKEYQQIVDWLAAEDPYPAAQADLYPDWSDKVTRDTARTFSQSGLSLAHVVVKNALDDREKRRDAWLKAFELLALNDISLFLKQPGPEELDSSKFPIVFAISQGRVAKQVTDKEGNTSPVFLNYTDRVWAVYQALIKYPIAEHMQQDILTDCFREAAVNGLLSIGEHLLNLTPASLKMLWDDTKDYLESKRNDKRGSSSAEENKKPPLEGSHTLNLPASALYPQQTRMASGSVGRRNSISNANSSYLFGVFYRQMYPGRDNILHYLARTKNPAFDTFPPAMKHEVGDQQQKLLAYLLRDVNFGTSLSAAQEGSNVSPMQKIAERRADRRTRIEFRNTDDMTPISLAVKAHNLVMFNFLRASPFEANINPNNDMLHMMCKSWPIDDMRTVFKELAAVADDNRDAMVKFNAKDKFGQTALAAVLSHHNSGLFVEDRQKDVLMFLLESGVRVSASNLNQAQLNQLSSIVFEMMVLPRNAHLRFLILKKAIQNGDEVLSSMILRPTEKRHAVAPFFHEESSGDDLLLVACDEMRCVDEDGLDQRDAKIVEMLMSYKPIEEIDDFGQAAARKSEKPASPTATAGGKRGGDEPRVGGVTAAAASAVAAAAAAASGHVNKKSIQHFQSAKYVREMKRLAQTGFSNDKQAEEERKRREEAEQRRRQEHEKGLTRINLLTKDKYGRTALHLCGSALGRPQVSSAICALLLGHPEVDIAATDYQGWNALHHACKSNQVAMVDLMIRAHMDLNSPSTEAAPQWAKLKVEYDAMVSRGQMRVMSTTSFSSASTSFGAPDQVIRDARGRAMTYMDNVKRDYKADPSSLTPLHLAAQYGFWQITITLLDARVEVDQIDSEFETPLTKALRQKRQLGLDGDSNKKLWARRQKALAQFALSAMSNAPAPAPAPVAADSKADEKASNHIYASSIDLSAPSGGDSTRDALPSLSTTSTLPSSAPTSSSAAAWTAAGFNAGAGTSTISFALPTLASSANLTKQPSDARERDTFASAGGVGGGGGGVGGGVPVGYSSDTELKRQIDFMESKSADYQRTIAALFRHGADIQNAMRFTTTSIDKLLDVDGEFREVVSHCNEWDDKIAKERHALDFSSERIAAYEKNRDQRFLDKLTQIVINEWYQRNVRVGHVFRLLWYFVFLMLLTIMGVYETTRDTQSAFYFHESLTNSLIEAPIDPAELNFPVSVQTYNDISAPEDWYAWALSSLHDTMYTDTAFYYDGPNLVDRGGGWVNGLNRLIGVPRLRQLRSNAQECAFVNTLDEKWRTEFTPVCFYDVGDPSFNEETENWGRNSTPLYDAPGAPRDHFVWTSTDETTSIQAWGRYAWYPSSGYILNFPDPTQPGTNGSVQFRQLINTLRDIRWIDTKTRAIFVEFSMYNPAANHFIIGRVLTELPSTGGFFPTYDFTITRLKRYMTNQDVVIGAFQLVLALTVSIYTYKELVQMWKKRILYFGTVWNALDVIIFSLLITIFVLHLTALAESAKVDFFSVGVYVEMSSLARTLETETGLWSFVTLLAWAKFLEHLAVFKSMARLLVMIEKMVARLGSWLILYAVILIGFATSEYIAYGYKDPQGYRWIFSFLQRVNESFGGLSLFNNFNLDRGLGTFYTLVFIGFTLLIMLNLIIAILTTAYEEAANESGPGYWAKRQYDMCEDQFGDGEFDRISDGEVRQQTMPGPPMWWKELLSRLRTFCCRKQENPLRFKDENIDDVLLANSKDDNDDVPTEGSYGRRRCCGCCGGERRGSSASSSSSSASSSSSGRKSPLVARFAADKGVSEIALPMISPEEKRAEL